MDKYFRIYKDIDGSTVFRYHFPSLVSLVEYLKTAEPNREVFTTLFSELPDERGKNFRGESLEDTLNHLIYGYNQTYEEYLEKSKMREIEIFSEIDYGRVKPIRGYSGSRVDINAYLNGEDKCMLRAVRSVPKQFKTINYDLSYKASITESQIFNRGAICMLIISALEQNNISVNLNCFNLLEQVINQDETKRYAQPVKKKEILVPKKKEILYVTVNLKDVDETLNEPMCIGPFNRKEFLRRVIFRLLEVSPVDKAWRVGHGYVIKDVKEIERIIEASPDDLTFHDPDQMGIKGDDLAEDFEAVVDYFKLEDVIKLRKTLK